MTMSEILDRLRELQRVDERGEKYGYVRDIWKCAADEIERLTRERDLWKMRAQQAKKMLRLYAADEQTEAGRE